MKLAFALLFLSMLFTACTNQAENVPTSAGEVNPLLIGSAIPDITLSSSQDESINLAAESTENTLFVFYRGGWCPFCSAELAELAQIEDELYGLGINIVAISPDSPNYLRESLNGTEMNYTRLSDSRMDASKAFGIAYQVDDETVQQYKNNGMDLEERSGYSHHLLPVPAVFLANSEGIIEFQYVNPDYTIRIDKNLLLAAVDAMLEEQ